MTHSPGPLPPGMVRIHIANATALQLDWLMGQREGHHLVRKDDRLHFAPGQFSEEEAYSPSTDHAQGGPVIEEAGITVHQHRDVLGSLWEYSDREWAWYQSKGRHVEIVQRALNAGPGRGILEHKKPGPLHKTWFAAMGQPHSGWKFDEHFPSPTFLIAGIRCFLAGELGKTALVPADLV